MQALIVYASLTGNTRRVARALAEELSCPAVDVRKRGDLELASVELLLVGDGVYGGRPSRAMARFLQALPRLEGLRAAVFGTYGAKPSQLPRLVELLRARGAQVVGEFACPGRDWFALGLLRRGRPNARDLARARAFARRLSSAF